MPDCCLRHWIRFSTIGRMRVACWDASYAPPTMARRAPTSTNISIKALRSTMPVVVTNWTQLCRASSDRIGWTSLRVISMTNTVVVALELAWGDREHT